MKKYNYELKTLSTMILSPRGQGAFYLNKKLADGGDEGYIQVKDIDKIKILYPFYQYGLYDEFNHQTAQYYIPGSSIKGAIGCSSLMIDDIRISNENVKLKHLYKIQGIPDLTESAKQSKLSGAEIFFPMLAVEMMDAGVSCKGDLFSECNPAGVLEATHHKTERKLKQMADYSKKVLNFCDDKTEMATDGESGRAGLKKYLDHISDLLYQAKNLEKNTYFMFLGGYKGLLLSDVFESFQGSSAVYVDAQRNLPHGLVQLTLECD